LFFIYQVCESDPGSPSRHDIISAFTSGVSAILSYYSGNYLEMVTQGFEALTGFIDICMRAAGRGDDLYPIYGIILNKDLLLNYTSGSCPGPQDEPIFGSTCNSDHFSLRSVRIIKGNRLQWTVLYSIFREEEEEE